MNLIYKLLFFLFLLLPFTTQAQVTNGNDITVEVSKEKTVINGKTFFLHTVKKSENIYRISKAYKVTQKDIIIANPEAISGSIKEGQILRIPAEPGAPRNIQQIESDNFIYHIAEEQQTIYFLTQKYKITDKDLFKYNPELEFSPLQVGQVVKIPKSPNVPVGAEKFKPIDRYLDHKVGKKDTKYSIAQQYNISVDELIAANPSLNTEDIQKGQLLKIPVKSETEIVTVPVVKPDTVKVYTENQKVSVPCNDFKQFSEQLNVAFLFPISLEGTQTLAMVDSVNKEKRNLETNEFFQIASNLMEFYQGALLAVDSLKKLGLSVKIFIYDTGKDNSKLTSILARPEFPEMDLIIGPLTKNATALEKTAEFSKIHKIKMVSPVFSEDKLVIDNPYVFEVSPSEATNAEYVVKLVASQSDKNIVLVNSNDPKDKENFEIYKSKLEAILPGKYKVYNYTSKNLSSVLSNNGTNTVIIPSEDRAIIQNLLNILNYSQFRQATKIYGLASWAVIKGLEQEYLHDLELRYPSAFFVDFTHPAIHNFLAKYKYFYRSEPYFHSRDMNTPQYFSREGYNFAFLGYDITLYFLQSMGMMGKDFEPCIGQQKIDLLHTNIIFQRISPQGGFVNQGVNIIKYTKDYYIVKEN